jgi:predicted O-methyltransferase YrrM
VSQIEHAFPTGDLNVPNANLRTVEFFATSGCACYAEIGVYKGDTTLRIAELMGGRGQIHLFDFDDRVQGVAARLAQAGHDNVVCHANSRRLLDSYNWSLMQMLAASPEPVFDYVFLDGAHTWALDALAFCLIDRLLVDGGYIDFDDYSWTLAGSPSMRPEVFPDVRRLYSDEQIDTAQVALVVDLLVRRNPGYHEIVADKIFRKGGAA